MKRKASIAIICTSLAAAAILATGSSLGWFNSQAFLQNSENPIEGSVQDKYYASGTGAYNDPFVINQPRHLYNLAWLQYLGFYNKNDGGVDDHQFYFVLGDNIDMSAFGAIPPIGTEQNPFIGHFDGQGYVVSNVTITNNFNDYDSHPSAMDSGWDDELNHQQPHILGFFGVVGYPGGNKNTSYDTAVNEFVNTGLTGVTVETVLEDSLMGVAAGLVYDSDLTDTHTVMNNIITDNSTISLPEEGETSSYGGRTSNISDFTIVGFTNNTKGVARVTETMYEVNSDSNITFSASEDGNINGWGGSINMINMYDRIVDVRENYSTSTTTPAWKKNHVIKPGGEKNTSADTTTTASTSMETSNTTTLRTFNHSTSGYQKAGNYVTTRRGGSDTILNYNYLQGGTFNVYNYQKYYHHTGHTITVDGEHYLTSTNLANNGAVTASNEEDAIVWTIPTTGTTGKIYTTYNYTDYYLAVNGSTVNLRTGSANGTTWDIYRYQDGTVRYSYNGYYLNYDNGWVMTALPEEPQEPAEPQEPVEPVEPLESNYTGSADEYQISDGTNYLKYTGSGSATFSTGLSDNVWKFTNINGSTTKIYVVIGNTNYYTVYANGNVTLSNRESNGTTWTKGGTNQFYYLTGSRYYYLRNNNGTLNCYRSGRNASLNLSYATSFTITSMADIAHQQYLDDHEAWETEHASWVTDHANWVTDHANWVTNHANWVTNHANWVTQMDNLHPITVEADERDGPDIDNTYDRTEYGMEYKSTDTTFFPLNVTKDNEQTHTSTTNTISDYYPVDTNTGYITIGSNFTSSTTQMTKDNSSMRFSRYNAASDASTNNIKNSFKTGDTSLTNVKTVNASGTVVDVDNALAETYEKYTDSKSAFEDILTSSSALSGGTRYLYGLHFMDATISMDHILNADWVSIGGEEKTNYDLPVNAIDFNLKETGYINFFAGSYFTDDVDSFFSLHKVVRSGNRITNIFEIEEIYKDTSTTAQNHAYVYKLKDNSGNFTYTCPYTYDAAGNKTTMVAGKDPEDNNLTYTELPAGYKSASSCIFKTSQIKSNTLDQYYAYYFEIPMNAGEYCLGSVPGGVGGYLLYLDIGANAAKTNRTVFYEKFVVTEKTYKHPAGVALMELPTSFDNYEVGEAVININVTIDDSDSACMVIKATALGDFSIDRASNQVALTRAQASNAPPVYASLDITKVYDVTDVNTNIEPQTVSSSSYDVKRMEFFDYVINSDTLMHTVITDKSNGNGGYTRTIVQKLYNGNTISGNPTATYTYDATTDQRSSMKIYNHNNSGIKFTNAQLIDQNSLVISSNKLSNTPILTYRLNQTGSSENDKENVIVAVIDGDNLTGTFYLFDHYVVTITPPANGYVTITVTSWDGETVIYFNTVEVNSGSQVIVLQG